MDKLFTELVSCFNGSGSHLPCTSQVRDLLQVATMMALLRMDGGIDLLVEALGDMSQSFIERDGDAWDRHIDQISDILDGLECFRGKV